MFALVMSVGKALASRIMLLVQTKMKPCMVSGERAMSTQRAVESVSMHVKIPAWDASVIVAIVRTRKSATGELGFWGGMAVVLRVVRTQTDPAEARKVGTLCFFFFFFFFFF